MKIKLFIVFFILHACLFSLQINKNHLGWDFGSSRTYYQGSFVQADFDLTEGSGKTWDFPEFDGSNYRTYTAIEALNPDSPWEQADMQLHWEQIANGYPGEGSTYFKTTEEDYLNLGMETTVASPYNPPIPMRFPHNLGNSHTSDHGLGGQTITVNADVLAQGTANLAIGSFEALLVRIEYAYPNFSFFYYQWETVEHGIVAEALVNNYNDVLFVLNSTQQAFICDFEADVTIGQAPLTVNFTNLSDPNATSWEWDFDGDDVVDSTEQNPHYTYTEAGDYTVILTVSDGEQTTSCEKVNYINTTTTSASSNQLKAIGGLNCYPNPFNPSTTFNYSIKSKKAVRIDVYNLLGQKIESFDKGSQAPGNYSHSFNAYHLSSGIYFVKLVAGNESITKKIMLLK